MSSWTYQPCNNISQISNRAGLCSDSLPSSPSWSPSYSPSSLGSLLAVSSGLPWFVSGCLWLAWGLGLILLTLCSFCRIWSTIKICLIIWRIGSTKLLARSSVGLWVRFSYWWYVALWNKYVSVSTCWSNLAIGIIKASADFTREQFYAFLIPVFITILQVAYLAIWMTSILYIFSSSKIEPVNNTPFGFVQFNREMQLYTILYVFGLFW